MSLVSSLVALHSQRSLSFKGFVDWICIQTTCFKFITRSVLYFNVDKKSYSLLKLKRLNNVSFTFSINPQSD